MGTVSLGISWYARAGESAIITGQVV